MNKTAARSSADPFVAPADYEAMFEQYWDYVVGLVRKLGFSDQLKEDVAADILLRFYERDFLAEFDPDMDIQHGGKKLRARFQSFLNAFVVRYSLGHRDRHATIKHREPLVCDIMIGDGSSRAPWVEVFGGNLEDDYGSVEEAEIVARIREHLESCEVRGKRDLVRLFDLLVTQVRTTGKENRQDLAREFGVSDSAIGSMLKDLREEAAIVMAVWFHDPVRS